MVYPVLGDVPLPEITAAMLKALLAGLSEHFAFASRVKVYAGRYGIEHFHPHKLRHTSASLAITNGADAVSVAACLGHSDSSTTLRMYAHANEESIRRVGQTVREALKEPEKRKA